MTKEELRKGTDLFLLDLDGTVYLSDTPVAGVAETLSRLREEGKRIVYLTNNSSRTRAEYVEKLTRLGLFGRGDDVYTSAHAAAEYLTSRGARRVYALATDAVRAELAAAGVALGEHSPDVALLAYDTQLTFAEMKKFNEALASGCLYVATHPDDVCPTDGVPMPDVGSFIALFERSSGRRPDVVCGKPYTVMGECIARKYRVPAARTCMVGDRMHTDIRFGNANEMRTLLVLSGETTRESMAAFPDVPDLVLPSLAQIF